MSSSDSTASDDDGDVRFQDEREELDSQRKFDPIVGAVNALPSSEPGVLASIEKNGPARRLAVGLSSSLPFLGAFAAWSTVEAMSIAKGFSPEITATGLKRGAVRWLPFGVGAAMFYALEHELRGTVAAWPLPGFMLPPLSTLPPPLRNSSDGSRRLTQYEQLFGVQEEEAAPESRASKALAGAAAALVVTSILFVKRRRGFRSIGSILGTSAGCGLAAVFMPSWEEVEKRSPL